MTAEIQTTSPAELLHQPQAQAMETIKSIVLDAVNSPRTRREYNRALTDFLVWHRDTGQTGLQKAMINAHFSALTTRGVTPSSIRVRLSAIRKLMYEAADNGMIEQSAAQAMARVKGPQLRGRKTGQWLTLAQAQDLVNAPDLATLKGLRDRAMIAILLGAGLRREELTRLTVDQVQQREARWILANVLGKRNKYRTVPIAPWVKLCIDAWTSAAGIVDGPLFRPMRKGDNLQDGGMNSQAVWTVVSAYSHVAPHDLRRTFAKLAYNAGVPVEQISLSLGHDSIETTMVYIGLEMDYQHAPSDGIKICLASLTPGRQAA